MQIRRFVETRDFSVDLVYAALDRIRRRTAVARGFVDRIPVRLWRGRLGLENATLADQLDNRNKAADADDESSPILGSWPRAYTAVLIHLALWIVVLYVFTVRFDLP